MGREYYYCTRCQSRLDSEDLDTGKCARVKDQIACENCLGEVIAPLSFKEQEQILLELKTAREKRRAAPPPPAAPAPRSPSGTSLRVPTLHRPSGSTLAPPIDSGRQVGAILVLGLALLLGVLGVLYFVFGNSRVEEPSRAPASAYEPLRVYKADPGLKASPAGTKDASAKSALDKARDSLTAKAPLETQLGLFEAAVRECEGTPYAETARGERDQARRRVHQTLESELGSLDKEAKGASDKEEFRRAITIFEQARSRHAMAEWTDAIAARVSNVSVKDAWVAFIPLRDQALDAKKRNAAGEVKVIADRVGRWDLPNFVLELERVLAATTSSPPTPSNPANGDLKAQSEEAKAYQRPWAEAMDLAATRDYDSAAAVLKRASELLKEDGARSEAQSDLEAIRQAGGALLQALQVLAQWPKGEKVSFEFRDELLSLSKANDPFVRADRVNVEMMRGGETFVVEVSEITPRSLAEIFRARPGAKAETDSRPAALLCLIEGDADSARSILGGPPESIPWKYWARAAKMGEARGNLLGEAGKREVSARKLYYAAERERLLVKSRGVAIDRYRTLLNEFADTSIVKARRSHITAQREGAKDYVFLGDDLIGGGTFKLSRHPKPGACWTSDADSGRGKENSVDFTFYAFPDMPYRCWVYVGACCQETFVFWLQTTDLTVFHPDTKQVLSCEPGAGVSMPVRNSITFLKLRHEMHGGPKEPKRWEWVSVLLPKYTAAGLKTVRLLTESKGFSVGHAVVSTIRSGPPGEAEMKALLKAPPETAEPAGGAATAPATQAVEPRDPSLVGHWKLDETGGTAADASGNDNTGILVGEPARGPGKIGNALLLDGRDRYVNIPVSPSLERVNEGNYSITAWFRPNSKPSGADLSARDGAHAILMKAGLEGLRYGCDQRFHMEHALGGTASATVPSAGTYLAGGFRHVAGVVSRSEGSVKVYVDGKLEGTAPFGAAAGARDLSKDPWKIGIAAPGLWAADGAVDDVRIYARALSAHEIRALSGGSSAGPLIVSISSPGPNERFEANASITLSASVLGGEGRPSRVDFYQGTHLLGSNVQGPWVHSWRQVPPGMYTLTARAVDKSGGVTSSVPVSIRVGNPELYRAISLAGGATRIDGLQWEGSTAKNVAIKGEPATRPEAELSPPVDAARAAMLKGFVHTKEGTSATLTILPTGTYEVYLYLVGDGTPETFDLLIKGKLVHSKYVSGPAGRWERVGPWFVDVPDGVLDVSARGGEANFCGLEVWRAK
jgi:hypothetical protein